MARPAYNAICQHAAGGKPAIVFVPSRKHARMTSLDLLTFAAADGEAHRFSLMGEADLTPYLDKVRDAALKHALRYGVAFLHETMTPQDQSIVSHLFSAGAVQVRKGLLRRS